jgi:hypothetical protein
MIITSLAEASISWSVLDPNRDSASALMLSSRGILISTTLSN